MPSSSGPGVPDLLSLPAPVGWRARMLAMGTLHATAAITLIAIALSLATTYATSVAMGNTSNLLVDLGIATAVPLMVAPLVSFFAMRLLYEVEDARGRLHEAAIRDGLTNLYNRRFFMARLQAEVERSVRSNNPLSVILIDIDHFKLINDNRGHAIGDEVLEAIGSVLIGGLSPYDVSARFGGEEFVALLPGANLEVAESTAERVRNAIAMLRFPAFDDAPMPHVTASLGISCLRGGDDTLAELLSRADQAMYRAKRAGRNRCIVFQGLDQVQAGA